MSSALEINLERIDICEIQDELPMTGKTGLIFFHTGSHPTRTKKGGGNKNFCQTHPGSLIQEVKNNGSPNADPQHWFYSLIYSYLSDSITRMT
jgi:hypothetical protein